MKAFLTRTLALALTLILLSPSPSSADQPHSTLLFADQSKITGKVLNIHLKDKILNLKSPSLRGKAQLNTSQLLEISLPGKARELDSDHYALATIKQHFRDSHQDTLRGRLVNLDENTITLDTWYAGELTLKRSLVHSLDIFTHSPNFYAGPNGPDGWTSASGKLEDNWTFKNRSMISKSHHGVARQIAIPERAKISLTASWKNAPYFRIFFLSTDGKSQSPQSAYSLNVRQNRLTLHRSSNGQRTIEVFNEAVRNLSELEQSTLTIYLDRSPEGKNAVYLDDKHIATWADVDDKSLTGEWLQIIPNRNTPLKISNISVNQWDGIFPLSQQDHDDKKDLESTAPKLDGQEIRLSNGDIVIGNIKNIDKDLAHLDTSFGKVEVPLRHMKNIMLADMEDEDLMESRDIRAWFHEGGYVTIRMESFDGKNIKGYSQVYGEATFQVEAFSRLQFNIWRPELEAARLGGDSDDW